MSVLRRETVRQIIAQAMVPSRDYAYKDLVGDCLRQQYSEPFDRLPVKVGQTMKALEKLTGEYILVVENLTELYFSNSPRNGVSIDSLLKI